MVGEVAVLVSVSGRAVMLWQELREQLTYLAACCVWVEVEVHELLWLREGQCELPAGWQELRKAEVSRHDPLDGRTAVAAAVEE